jgi:hypothetical protein
MAFTFPASTRDIMPSCHHAIMPSCHHAINDVTAASVRSSASPRNASARNRFLAQFPSLRYVHMYITYVYILPLLSAMPDGVHHRHVRAQTTKGGFSYYDQDSRYPHVLTSGNNTILLTTTYNSLSLLQSHRLLRHTFTSLSSFTGDSTRRNYWKLGRFSSIEMRFFLFRASHRPDSLSNNRTVP